MAVFFFMNYLKFYLKFNEFDAEWLQIYFLGVFFEI